MKTISTWSAAALLTVALLACGPTVIGPGGAGGDAVSSSSSSSSGSSGSGLTCAGVCEKIVAACSDVGITPADCNAACVIEPDLIATCPAEYDAWLTCVDGDPSGQCMNSDPTCNAAIGALQPCLEAACKKAPSACK